MAVKVTSFYNYKDYLESLCCDYKLKKPSLTYTALSRFLGFNSHNALMQIISGKRRLGLDAAIIIADKLNLEDYEKDYLICLVNLCNCENKSSRDYFQSRLLELRESKGIFSSKNKSLGADVLSSIIWVLSFYETEDEIVKFLNIDQQFVQKVLKEIEIGSENAKNIHQYTKLSQPHEVQSYFRDVHALSKAATENPPKESDFHFSAVAINPTNYHKARKVLKEAIEKINSLCNGTDVVPEYYGFHIQLFQLKTLFNQEKAEGSVMHKDTRQIRISKQISF